MIERLRNDNPDVGDPASPQRLRKAGGLDRLTEFRRGKLTGTDTIADGSDTKRRQTFTLDALGNWAAFHSDNGDGNARGTRYLSQTRSRSWPWAPWVSSADVANKSGPRPADRFSEMFTANRPAAHPGWPARR